MDWFPKKKESLMFCKCKDPKTKEHYAICQGCGLLLRTFDVRSQTIDECSSAVMKLLDKGKIYKKITNWTEEKGLETSVDMDMELAQAFIDYMKGGV